MSPYSQQSKCRTGFKSENSWGLAGTLHPQEAFSPLTLAALFGFLLYTFTELWHSHTCVKELSSAIHRGEYLINYPYSSMEMEVVLRLNIACPHSEDLDCNAANVASFVASLAHRFSLREFIPGFGWWCEQFGLLNKSWFLSHASVVWKHVAERLWHCSIKSQICLVVSVVVVFYQVSCAGLQVHTLRDMWKPSVYCVQSRLVKTSLQTHTKVYFRAVWRAMAAVSVSETVGKCGFQRRDQWQPGFWGSFKWKGTFLYPALLCFLGERIWV